MRKSLSYAGVAAAALFLAGCGDVLAVKNKNAPSVESSFSTSKGIELLIGGLGVQLNNAQRATEGVNTQSKILAGESFATVANFGMAARATVPRNIISNELGNDNQVGNLANFANFQRYARNGSEAIRRLDLLKAAGDSLAPRDEARAKAMAYNVIGQALGYLSLMYEQAAIITPASAPVDPSPTAAKEPLSPAAAVNVVALQMLDSAIAWAGRGSAANPTMSNLPSTWISGNALTSANFIRLMRSYKARIRAGVARTEAERALVDWSAVIADAQNGITADFNVSIGGSTGWGAQFDAGQVYVAGGWHSVPMLYLGFADTSTTGMQRWILEDQPFRRAFLVKTADLRWVPGNTRPIQQAYVGTAPPLNATSTPIPSAQCVGDAAGTTNCARYFRNRPSNADVPVSGYGESQYDHRRYAATVRDGAGPYTEMSKTEIDMLQAEGLIRRNAAGDVAAAEALINLTRVKNGLGSVTGIGLAGTVPLVDAGNPNSCIPRVPSGATLVCGSLLEAMKYEKRVETMMTGYGISFTDNRGWGDLIPGTVIEWPVPYQEMQARQSAFTNGTNRFLGPNTYGYNW